MNAASACVFSTKAALQRVFMSNSLRRTERAVHISRVFLPRIQVATWPQARFYAGGSRRGASANVTTRLPKTSKFASLPRNNQIKSGLIYVVQGQALGEPQRTSDVLARLNLKREVLVAVRMPDPERKDENAPDIPVCRIVNIQEQYDMDKAQADARRKLNSQSKALEVNWAIDPHDLGHRLRQLEKFLDKGYRVDITFKNKRVKGQKSRRASLDEAKATLKRVEDAFMAVEGTKEITARDGTVGEEYRIALQGMKKDTKAKNDVEADV